jgi:hypothetical protein
LFALKVQAVNVLIRGESGRETDETHGGDE